MSFLDNLKSLLPKRDPAQLEFESKITEIAHQGNTELSETDKNTIREALDTLRRNGGDDGDAMRFLENRGRLAPGISARPAFRAIAVFLQSEMDTIER